MPHIAPRYGMLCTTFGGNNLSCAAAIAVCDVIEQDNLIENAQVMGDYLMTELKKLDVKDVRGRGLMIGVELNEDSAPIRKKLLYDDKIFLGSTSNKNVIRLLPALNITKEHCNIFLDAFKKYV